MKHWLRRFSAILLTILTLGMYIPPDLFTPHFDQKLDDQASELSVDEAEHQSDSKREADVVTECDETSSENKHVHETYVHMLTEKAKIQCDKKFGPRIAGRVEGQFTEEILPHIGMVIDMIFDEVHSEELIYYGMTKEPANGYGERIFNLYDYRTGQDIARFDVRREKRPLDGYWFNFHYHLHDDQFVKHYNLGDIYWDKNTPPKWMT